MIRRRILWRLIWVCTVCLCPTKRTLGLYGLKILKNTADEEKASKITQHAKSAANV